MRKDMDQPRARVNILKLTVMVLGISTWIFVSDILSSRPGVAAPQLDPLNSLARLPASLPAQLPKTLPAVFTGAPKVPEVVRMDVLALRCWDASDESAHQVSARWIRLTGRSCEAKAVPEAMQIRNLTNGYVATVFVPAAGSPEMTTDFLPLEKGANEIMVRLDQGGGVALENIFTVRRD